MVETEVVVREGWKEDGRVGRGAKRGVQRAAEKEAEGHGYTAAAYKNFLPEGKV